MAPNIFLDLETTGVHLRRRPWEIAFIVEEWKPAGPHGATALVRGRREIVVHITDVDLTDAQPKALEISRFYQRHVDHADYPDQMVARFPLDTAEGVGAAAAADAAEMAMRAGDLEPGTIIAVTEATAAHLVRSWCSPSPEEKANLIGLNTWFDAETLAWMLDRHGLFDRAPWDHHLTNIAGEAAGWLRGQLQLAHQAAITAGGMVAAATAPIITNTLVLLEKLPRNSAVLSRLCGVEPPGPAEAHTGLGDTRWVVRWWDHIQNGPSPRPWFTPHPAPVTSIGRHVHA